MRGNERFKKAISAILILMMILSLSACNTDSLREYKNAVEKTEQIKKGHTAGEFSLSMDFNTEGLTDEELKNMNYYKDIKGSYDAVFDSKAKKVIYRNYLNLGGLGFDYDMYFNGDEMLMKLPVVGKYIKLNDLSSSVSEQNKSTSEDMDEENIISQETIDGISDSWIKLIKRDDVFKGKNIVLTTPDGEVKTTEYTIKLTDEQIKQLSAECIELISNDEKLKNFYDELKKDIELLSDTTFEEQIRKIREHKDDFKVENFNYIAHVDIDGYIVNETVELKLSLNDNGKGSMLGLDYKLDTKNWDINKEQSFDFPTVTDENTLKMDDLKDSEMFMIEDLFKNKN